MVPILQCPSLRPENRPGCRPALLRPPLPGLIAAHQLCVGVTTAGCCSRNSSNVSLGTFTCCPFVNTCTPAPAAEPTPAPIDAPSPPPAMAPIMAPTTAPPPTFLAVSDPRPFPFKL